MLVAGASPGPLGRPIAFRPSVSLPMSKGGAGRKVEREVAEIATRHDLQRTGLRGAVWVAGIVASWVPISAVREIVVPFAGKNTDINVNIVVGISITLAFSLAANIVMWVRGRQRVREINRQRERADRLETDQGIPVPKRKEK